MKKINNKLKLVSFCIFAGVILFLSPLSVAADQTPIVSVDDVEDTYRPESYPASYGDWDYYTIPPGTNYYNVYYLGGSGPSGTAQYTDVGSNNFNDYDRSLTRGELIGSSSLLSDDTRSSQHNFFDSVLYPRAVRIESSKDAEFLASQKASISLHEDYASTFFAEGGTLYTGYVQTNDSFFLDVSFSNSKAMGNLWFSSAYPQGGYTVGVPESRMTYPFIPIVGGIQQFTLSTNDSTLVTLTPHEWEFPSWIPDLEVNTIFSEEFDQGEPWTIDDSTDQLVEPTNEMFSLRMFNLTFEKDQYYRINTVFEMEEVKPGVLSSQPITNLLGEHFEVISGTLDQEGLSVRATEDEGVILFMYSPGEAHGTYSIFFQEISAFTVQETEPLDFNVDIAPEHSIFYEFTLNSPAVLRFNSSIGFDYDVYVEVGPGQWFYEANENFFGGAWRYLPSGSYAIEFSNFNVDDEIRVNKVQVESPGALPYTVDEDSIFAIELPLTKNRVNFVNLSTTDHINQSITYSYTVVSKYNELVTTGSSSVQLGNREMNGVWDAWPTSNNSVISQYLPTRDYDTPILVVYPTSAQNLTSPLTEFAGTLEISTNEAIDQSWAPLTFSAFSSAFAPTGFAGTFIPQSQISSTDEFDVNSEQTIDDDQVFGIPLDLDRNSIYNITVYLIGNYSTTASLNVTFENRIHVHGGNLRDLDIFGTYRSGSDDLQAWQTMLILTVSDTSYLFADVERQVALYNGTLRVVISKLSATALSFDLDQEYNDTVSDNEVKQKGLVVKKITPAEMKKSAPGFELITVVITASGFSYYISRKRRRTN